MYMSGVGIRQCPSASHHCVLASTLDEFNDGPSTQLSDVESEVSGFLTYDRVLKLDDAGVRRIAAVHTDLKAAAT